MTQSSNCAPSPTPASVHCLVAEASVESERSPTVTIVEGNARSVYVAVDSPDAYVKSEPSSGIRQESANVPWIVVRLTFAGSCVP